MKTILICRGCRITLSLAGCSSTPTVPTSPPLPPRRAKSGGYYLDDGPEATPPPNLDAIPDAVPRDEPLHRFANRPYDVLGSSYVPQTERRTHQRRRRGIVVRQALSRQKNRVGRALRHVCHDGCASDFADSELCAGHLAGQR